MLKFFCFRQLGVSIPENTKETPVMIISELCANGDLFDYVRNVSPPSLYKVVSEQLYTPDERSLILPCSST